MIYNKAMNKERRERARSGALRKVLTAFALALLAATVVCALYFSEDAVSAPPNYDYGEYTFEREMVVDGKSVSFYESGDERFRYYHDSEGYILIADRQNNTLTYAVDDGGAPVSGGVSVTASEKEIAAVPKITYLNLSSDYIESVSSVSTSARGGNAFGALASEESATIVNLVIFIAFKDETYAPSGKIDEMLNGSGSVRSYYQVQSGGKINVVSEMPYANGSIFVYRDSESRKYYNVEGSSLRRQTREATLLTNAVKAASEYFASIGINADADGDGYADSVSFIVCGSSSGSWGSLLWPHSWNLDDIDGSGYSTICGVKVGDYSFNFDTALDVGVLAHEMGHVLGAPDLYHYDDDYSAVGEWDLMGSNLDTPQYMLTYIRDKYLGGIENGQIKDITSNGTYSLSPVSAAEHVNGTLAYRIYTDTDEYFMLEYRRITVSGFDSELPGSGLIVYRIKEPDDFSTSTGNMHAKYHGSGSLADEVFVFRPDLSDEVGGSVYFRSDYEVGYAYLSPYNTYFKSVGSMTSTDKFDPDCLYYSNGTNSGIVIEANSISSTSIEFTVKLSNSAHISDQYFTDKIFLESAELVNVSEYSGVGVTLSLGDFDPQYLSALSVEALSGNGEVIATAKLNYGKFLTAYLSGQRTLDLKFVVSDKGNSLTSLFDGVAYTSSTEPKTVRLSVTDSDGDVIRLGTLNVSSSSTDWQTVLNTVTDKSPALAASSGITVAVNAFGIVDVSGFSASGRWAAEGYSGAVGIAAGRTHTLVLTEGLKVVEFGSQAYGEQNVVDWENIIAVSAGYYTSYGLTADGRVLAAGLNDSGQTDVSGFNDVTAISAGLKHVVMLHADGTVSAAGASSAYGDLGGISGAVAVAAGDNFTAVLLSDGSVKVSGAENIDVSGWNVVKIAAGSRHLIGLTADGGVVAAGDNSYDQCDVSGLTDIENIAAGEFHSAFLREDGVVLFNGYSGEYHAAEGIGNLKFDNYSPVTGIDVSISGGNRIAVGDTVSITVSTLPANPTYSRMTFDVSDTEILSVQVTGYTEALLTALKPGSVTLTVTALGTTENVTYSLAIEVYERVPLEGITFKEESVTVISGEYANLVLVLNPEDAYVSGEVTFTSSAPGTVEVGADGRVLALSPGSATVTAVLDGFSASCTVNVVDTDAVSITVVDSDNTPYRYGAPLDYSRYTLSIDIAGHTEFAALTADMVYGYNAYLLGAQTLSVSYMGVQTSFKVTVSDYIVRVAPKEDSSFKREYKYGESFDADVRYAYVKYFASGATEESTFLSNELKGYDPYKLGTQTLIFTYTDALWKDVCSFSVDVFVTDYVSSVSFTPLKSVYKYGEALFPGELVTLHMASGMMRYVDLNEVSVRDTASVVSDTGDSLYSLYSLRTGDHALEISYYDEAGGETHTTTANVKVELGGEFYFSGADAQGRFLYPVGGDLNIEISFVQYNTTVMLERAASAEQIPLSGGGIYYMLSGFDASSAGVSEVTLVNLYSVGQTLSASHGITTEPVLIGSWGITVYGYAASADVNLVTDKTEYLFGEAVSAAFEIEFGGETVVMPPMETRYDVTKVGEVEYFARYMDDWYSVIIRVNDYCTELLPVEDAVVDYGAAYVPAVVAIMACAGKVTLGAGDYVTEGDISTSVPGTRTITVSYGGKSVSFTLTVLNGAVSVEVSTPPRTVYRLNEYFDPTSEYIITYASGDTETVPFDETAFIVEPDRESLYFRVINETGIKVYIYYVGDGMRREVWNGPVTAPNYVTELKVALASDIVEIGSVPETSVTASFASGTSRRLSASEYSLQFDPNLLGVQIVTLIYDYKGVRYTETFTVTVIDAVETLTLLSAPAVVSYGYGATLNWTGASVKVKFKTGGSVTYSGSEIPGNTVVRYSTLVSGTNKVEIALGGKTVYFNISVGAPENAVTVANTDYAFVSIKDRRIVLYSPMAIDYARSTVVSMQSYLGAKYVSREGTVIQDYSVSAKTGDSYVLFNTEGLEVIKFKIYVNGDTDGDGKVTQNDIDSIAGILAGSGTDAYFDYNGDGKQNLTDLVLFQREQASSPASAPEPSPVNKMAKLMTAPVSNRKKELLCE